MGLERRERRKVEVRRTERRKRKPTRVPVRASQWWNQPSAIGLGDTERLTDALGDEAKSRSLSTEHPLTGKPDAGEPPVRFGGRGGVNRAIPTPIGGSAEMCPAGMEDCQPASPMAESMHHL